MSYDECSTVIIIEDVENPKRLNPIRTTFCAPPEAKLD
jgi:hypothetical protein